LDVPGASDAELAGTYDSTAGVHLTFEVARGAQGATARVSGETEGALLRVERGDAGEPAVWIGAVPLAEASEDAPRVELLRVADTDEWAAVAELLDALEGRDDAPALVATLRDGLELAGDAIALAAAGSAEPRTQEYSPLFTIHGCMSWYQGYDVANRRCQSFGYSYANWVAAWSWTRCGADSHGNPLYRTIEYQCYRGSNW